MIKQTYKWVVSGERYLSKYNPTGDPMAIPINSLKKTSNFIKVTKKY